MLISDVCRATLVARLNQLRTQLDHQVESAVATSPAVQPVNTMASGVSLACSHEVQSSPFSLQSPKRVHLPRLNSQSFSQPASWSADPAAASLSPEALPQYPAGDAYTEAAAQRLHSASACSGDMLIEHSWAPGRYCPSLASLQPQQQMSQCTQQGSQTAPGCPNAFGMPYSWSQTCHHHLAFQSEIGLHEMTAPGQHGNLPASTGDISPGPGPAQESNARENCSMLRPFSFSHGAFARRH